jgi:hypothetical protein
MRERGFFSYDFFIDGIFGLNIFTFFTALSLLVLSIFFVFSCIFIVKFIAIRKNRLVFKLLSVSFIKKVLMVIYVNKVEFFKLCTIILFNLLMLYLIYETSNNFLKNFLDYFLLIAALVYLHFSIIWYFHPKIGLYSLSVVFPFLVLISFVRGEETALTMQHGLLMFSSGGNVVSVSSISNKNEILTHGKLLLLSPKNIYVQDKNENLRIIERTNDIVIGIENPQTPRVVSINKSLETISEVYQIRKKELRKDFELKTLNKFIDSVEMITQKKFIKFNVGKGKSFLSGNLDLNSIDDSITLVWTIVDDKLKVFSNDKEVLAKILTSGHSKLTQDDLSDTSKVFVIANKPTHVHFKYSDKNLIDKKYYKSGWSLGGTIKKIEAKEIQCIKNYEIGSILKLSKNNYSIYVPDKLIGNMENFDYIYPYEGFMVWCVKD